MIFSTKARNVLLKIAALLSFLTAIYHLFGLFYKVNDSSAWRHFLFMGINLFCVYGFLIRPKYFVYLLAILLLQQYYSHGTAMIRLWTEKGQIDWISIFVVLLFPVAFICLLQERKTKL